MSRKARRIKDDLRSSEPLTGSGTDIIVPIIVPIIVLESSPGEKGWFWPFTSFLSMLLLAWATFYGPVAGARVGRPAAVSYPPARSGAVDLGPVLSDSMIRRLGNRTVAVRESAIIEVGQVAQLSADPVQRRRSLAELAAYVRRQAPQRPQDESSYCRQIWRPRYPSDVQLALDQLGNRHFDDRNVRIELYGVNAAFANLSARDLRHFVFDHALLCGADFSNAMLGGVSFRDANLSRAWMAGAIATNRQLLEAGNLFGMAVPALLPKPDPAVLRRVRHDLELSPHVD